MFDTRSYIISLIAVFLALGIGILMGTVVVDKGILVEQQKALVERIQNQINELRESNNTLSQDLKITQEFSAQVAPFLIADRLLEMRIVLLATADSPEQLVKDILSTLEQSGAQVLRINFISPAFDLQDKNLRQQINAYFPEADLSIGDLKKRIAEEIANNIAMSVDLSFIKFLTNLNLMRTGENLEKFEFPPNAVVLLGDGGQKKTAINKELYSPLISKFKELNLRTVAVEEAEAQSSQIGDYQQAGANATIDNIELVPGKVALVYALRGQDGNYGFKPTAQSLLPALQ